ncbi:hypothetical protein CLPU_9c00240 [Gottschalkia purinilytica]|uniref:Uncharacterized protein n=1 Tax=Gottschalkia purinilytica TaxID=1503 RepID=A0A0L0W998_GOTPU|nr:hypothetical protein [Gottschalkia purinilytica]KNF08128.1 hypothetical protein CLPU_9c00240 [Gottschalkia purinilytica]
MEKNKFLENIPKFLPMVIPAMLMLKDKSGDNRPTFNLPKLNLSLDEDFSNRVDMIKDIKHYFPEKDQKMLSKIQDVFEILDKIRSITKDDYTTEIMVNSSEMSESEKREMIIKEVSRHMGKEKRKLVENVLETKDNIFQSKTNLESYGQSITQNKRNGLESIVGLINCIEPIMRDEDKKKIRKIEKISEIMNSSDEKN